MGTARPSRVKREKDPATLLEQARTARFLNVELAAAYLDCSQTTIARYRAAEILPPKRYWTREELDAIVVPPKRGRKKTPAAASSPPPPTTNKEGGAPPASGQDATPGGQPLGELKPEASKGAPPSPSPPSSAPQRKTAEVNPGDPYQVNLPRPTRRTAAPKDAKVGEPPPTARKSAEPPPPAAKSGEPSDAKSGEPPQKDPFWW